MTTEIFTTFERERLNRLPEEVSVNDLITFFTITESDFHPIPVKSSASNRLGIAFQLCCLRYLGFYPNPPYGYPLEFVARQLKLEPSCVEEYGQNEHTRSIHRQHIQEYLGFYKSTPLDMALLDNWLLERALEHDQPTLLFHIVCEKLYTDKIVRPGISVLERMITSSRNKAHEVTYERLEPLIEGRKNFLDSILNVNPDTGWTPLKWLRTGAISNSPEGILETVKRLRFLKENGVQDWSLDTLNPNRRKFLAKIGRTASNQTLQRLAPQRRYPIVLVFLSQSLADITDELVDLFDRHLSDSYAKSKNAWEQFQLSVTKTTQEKLRMFQQLGGIVLDETVSDANLRGIIYQQIPQQNLEVALKECQSLVRPQDDKHYDFFATKYNSIRRYIPEFLEILEFNANSKSKKVLEAVHLLKKLNQANKRNVPEDAPMDFVSKTWRSYIFDDHGNVVRKYYELCTLMELKNDLCAGNIWVNHSRRYADPETYLIPKDQWPRLKEEACELLGLPLQAKDRLEERKRQLKTALSTFDSELNHSKEFRIENEELIVPRLKAEEKPDSSLRLQEEITHRLPRIELAELLIEVDHWTGFIRKLEHAGGSQPRNKEVDQHLYACILAQACNFGLKKMAYASDLSYDSLAWYTNWYLREETLQNCIDQLVNYQYHQPLSGYWGSGTLSSSDGQRFPVPVKARNAVSLPKYFGYGKGITFYSWTSDQFSQYGSRVIPTTIRDATYVLDAILDNETELEIMEHTTDTAGYTELVFALFDLLGMQFSPRIRDLGSQQLYRVDKSDHYQNIESLLKGVIHDELITDSWDELLRITASIKMGWVTASLLISKLKTYPRKNALTVALQEYGRLRKSIFIPSYLCTEEDQRRVGRQLNKGESLHDLRQFLVFANDGQIRKSQLEDQVCQASCLTLVTNAVIVWNTRYMKSAIDQLRLEGKEISEEDLRHISPCRFEHINKYGKYSFEVEKEMNREGLRELRNPKLV